MSENLKPCPAHESHKPVTFWKREVGGMAYRIECGYCGCTVTMPTRESAIAAWNARAPQEPQWQPIETAPRATWVLVHSNRNGYDVALQNCEGVWWNVEGIMIGPSTHWMPLPAPPEVPE